MVQDIHFFNFCILLWKITPFRIYGRTVVDFRVTGINLMVWFNIQNGATSCGLLNSNQPYANTTVVEILFLLKYM